MKDPKKSKKGPVLQDVSPLQPNDRFVHVVLHAVLDSEESASVELDKLYFLINFNGTETMVMLDDCATTADVAAALNPEPPKKEAPKRGERDKRGSKKSGSSSRSRAPTPKVEDLQPSEPIVNKLESVLCYQRMTLTLPTLQSILRDSAQHTIAIYTQPAPPPEPVATTVTTGRGALKRGQPVETAQESPARARQERGKKDKGHRRESILARSECLASSQVFLLDLMHASSSRYELHLSRPIQGVQSLWLELKSLDQPLLPPNIIKKYRPVTITIESMDTLPKLREKLRRLDHKDPSLQENVDGVHWADCTQFSLKFLGEDLHPTCVGGRPQSDGKSFLCRTICFLGDMSPLNVMSSALLEPVELSVSTCVDDESTPDGTAMRFIGAGGFSIESLVMDKQTFFHEVVQLLPRRSTVASKDSCLTRACGVTMSIEFYEPFPTIQHVDKVGRPVVGQHMTRGILVMPYSGLWVGDVLQCLIRELLLSERATPECDVYAFSSLEDDAANVPEAVEQSPPKKGASRGRKEKEREKERPKGKSPQRRHPPERTPDIVQLPTTATAFERPFQVVSPAGISGFEVIDGDVRIICLEGPMPEVHRILQAAASAADSYDNLTLLLNSELFIPRRAYVTFPPLVVPPVKHVTVCSEEPPAADVGRKGHISPSSSVGRTSATSSPSRTQSNTPSRKRKGKAAPPPVEVPAPIVEPPPHEASDQVEVEAGGTGGRIHRIRLRETFGSLMNQQHYLLRRSLSDSCISCFQKLYSLMHTDSLLHALRRKYFPSAGDLISLERSFGQTLDLMDLFSRQEYIMVSTNEDDSAAASARAHRRERRVLSSATVRDVDLSQLRPSDVGRLTSFQGKVMLGKPRAVPPRVAERYRHGLWMITTDGFELLCAFPKEVPGATLRYHVESQVVECDGTLLLYVLEFHSLAKGTTGTKNAKYEEALRQRRKKEKEWNAILCMERKGRHRHHEDGTEPAPMAAPHESVDLTRPDDSSDDEDANDANCPPMDLERSYNSFNAAPRLTGSFEGGIWQVHATKSSQARAAQNHPDKGAPEDYKMLWELYEKRAPKPPPKPSCVQPKMHF